MRIPIGQMMVDKGIITQDQCLRVLETQKHTHRPFGEIAEELLGVRAKEVERVWADQYALTTQWVDPSLEPVDPGVHDLITRRQAWQFRVLPMGHDGSELIICTTKESLVRAMNFATRHIPGTCYFVLSHLNQLGEALMRYYPMEGMSADVLDHDSNMSLSARLAAAPGLKTGT